jgi:hypothetical protein
MIARLVFYPPNPTAGTFLSIVKPAEKPKGIMVTARLAEKQYVNLDHIPKGTRMLVRGRLWEYKKGITEVEVREALMFQDRDFSQGAALADPTATAVCPLAYNELTGMAPTQPGGFGQRR